ncbi:MAG: hypothetical protein HYV07_08930 [Deltaproteobacteria bacterium]|nr:hypothetical protein [Deltaproteobacteria bacterium]
MGLDEVRAHLNVLEGSSPALAHRARELLDRQLAERSSRAGRGEQLPPMRAAQFVEVDGARGTAIKAAALELAKSALRKAGVEAVFVVDEELEGLDGAVDLAGLRKVYRDHFHARAFPEWTWLAIPEGVLYGRGWGALGKSAAMIAARDWAHLDGMASVRFQAHILLHELGHNFGLTHEPRDASYRHDNRTCVMATQLPPDPHEIPTEYCEGCRAHLSPLPERY